jgi:hypothetical protein
LIELVGDNSVDVGRVPRCAINANVSASSNDTFEVPAGLAHASNILRTSDQRSDFLSGVEYTAACCLRPARKVTRHQMSGAARRDSDSTARATGNKGNSSFDRSLFR